MIYQHLYIKKVFLIYIMTSPGQRITVDETYKGDFVPLTIHIQPAGANGMNIPTFYNLNDSQLPIHTSSTNVKFKLSGVSFKNITPLTTLKG